MSANNNIVHLRDSLEGLPEDTAKLCAMSFMMGAEFIRECLNDIGLQENQQMFLKAVFKRHLTQDIVESHLKGEA